MFAIFIFFFSFYLIYDKFIYSNSQLITSIVYSFILVFIYSNQKLAKHILHFNLLY